MRYLLLWLEAPLQSWGFESKFDLRSTALFPTMSGVYGILLASSGDSGAQCELLNRMKTADFSAVEWVPLDRKKTDDPSAVEGVPPKKAPAQQLCDYHMVGSGYNEKSAWESLHIPRKRDGAKAVGGGAKQTYRYYLQDKKFAVLLGFPDDLAEKFSASLQAPVFDLYLGRKRECRLECRLLTFRSLTLHAGLTRPFLTKKYAEP